MFEAVVYSPRPNVWYVALRPAGVGLGVTIPCLDYAKAQELVTALANCSPIIKEGYA